MVAGSRINPFIDTMSPLPPPASTLASSTRVGVRAGLGRQPVTQVSIFDDQQRLVPGERMERGEEHRGEGLLARWKFAGASQPALEKEVGRPGAGSDVHTIEGIKVESLDRLSGDRTLHR